MPNNLPLNPGPRNPPLSQWQPDNVLVHQPPCPLLYHETFERGGNALLNDGIRPNASQWGGPPPDGLPLWAVWNFGPPGPQGLVQAWVDDMREQGIVQVQGPNVNDALQFSGMVVPFPTPPAFPFRCIIYARCSLGHSIQEVSALRENFGGVFVSFNADLVSNGEIIVAGASQELTGYVGACAQLSDNATLAAPVFKYPGASEYVRLRVLCNSAISTVVQCDFSTGSPGQWWNPGQIFTAATAGIPKFMGIGAAAAGDATLTQGVLVAANYMRAYDGTALAAGSFATNGAVVVV